MGLTNFKIFLLTKWTEEIFIAGWILSNFVNEHEMSTMVKHGHDS